jgi:hypothetical protein
MTCKCSLAQAGGSNTRRQSRVASRKNAAIRGPGDFRDPIMMEMVKDPSFDARPVVYRQAWMSVITPAVV